MNSEVINQRVERKNDTKILTNTLILSLFMVLVNVATFPETSNSKPLFKLQSFN
jgi:hypothetical protein